MTNNQDQEREEIAKDLRELVDLTTWQYEVVNRAADALSTQLPLPSREVVEGYLVQNNMVRKFHDDKESAIQHAIEIGGSATALCRCDAPVHEFHESWNVLRYNGFTYQFPKKMPLSELMEAAFELTGEDAPARLPTISSEWINTVAKEMGLRYSTAKETIENILKCAPASEPNGGTGERSADIVDKLQVVAIEYEFSHGDKMLSYLLLEEGTKRDLVYREDVRAMFDAFPTASADPCQHLVRTTDVISIQEAWNAAGGNPELTPTKEKLLGLLMMNTLALDAARQPENMIQALRHEFHQMRLQEASEIDASGDRKIGWNAAIAAIGDFLNEFYGTLPEQPKLVLALPDYEKRRIVIASDEVIDGERVVCVVIQDRGTN